MSKVLSKDIENTEKKDTDIKKRYYKIKVKAYNLLTDREEIISLKGYPAIVMQHEMDHLYGILYFDHINKANPWYIDPKVIKI